MSDLDGQEREAMIEAAAREALRLTQLSPAEAEAEREGMEDHAHWAARLIVGAALAAREEPPTHFEWPEHYEVGETQTTACEIPLDGRSHTSYRKEVSCVACLQTMLGAREDTERPACPICGTHEWIPDVGCRRCAEGGAKGCGQCWTCKAHQEGLYGDVECETRFEGRIKAMRDERKRTCQANAPLCVHGEWPSQCPHPDCPGLQNPPDETIALAAREEPPEGRTKTARSRRETPIGVAAS